MSKMLVWTASHYLIHGEVRAAGDALDGGVGATWRLQFNDLWGEGGWGR